MKINTIIATITAAALCGLTVPTSRAQDIDSFAPVVVKTVPEAGTKDVPPGEYEVRITFSKEMADESWSWSSAWQNSDPKSLGKPHYEAGYKTCVMKVKLEPDKTYGWWINSPKFHGFQDPQHHPAIPYLLTFKTGEKLEQTSGESPDLREAKAHLAELRVEYSDQNPEVMKSLARVKELERMSKEEPNASAELREAKAHLAELRVDFAEQNPEVQKALARALEQK